MGETQRKPENETNQNIDGDGQKKDGIDTMTIQNQPSRSVRPADGAGISTGVKKNGAWGNNVSENNWGRKNENDCKEQEGTKNDKTGTGIKKKTSDTAEHIATTGITTRRTTAEKKKTENENKMPAQTMRVGDN